MAEVEAAYTAAEEAENSAEEAAAEDERLVEEATKANAEASAAKPATDAKVATLTAESTWWTAMATKFTPWEGKHGDTCAAFDVVVNVGGVACLGVGTAPGHAPRAALVRFTSDPLHERSEGVGGLRTSPIGVPKSMNSGGWPHFSTARAETR